MNELQNWIKQKIQDVIAVWKHFCCDRFLEKRDDQDFSLRPETPCLLFLNISNLYICLKPCLDSNGFTHIARVISSITGVKQLMSAHICNVSLL